MAEFRQTHAQNGIEIRKNDQPDRLRLLTNFRSEGEYLLQGDPVFERTLTGPLYDRPIRKRVAEWDTELNHSRSSLNRRQNHVSRRCQIWVATSHVGNERGLVLKVKGHEGSVKISHQRWHSDAGSIAFRRSRQAKLSNFCIYICISYYYHEISCCRIRLDDGNRGKCQKHGVSIAEIEALFLRVPRVAPDPRHSADENRLIAVGKTVTGRTLFVAFTMRTNEGRRLIRPVTARYMHARR